MSVSIKRAVYRDVPFAGGDVGNWLCNHFPSSVILDAQANQVTVTREDLEENLKLARECDATCEFFEGNKENHDRITEEMAIELPKVIDQMQKEDPSNSGWIDLQVWW